jgi:hypothetical protein
MGLLKEEPKQASLNLIEIFELNISFHSLMLRYFKDISFFAPDYSETLFHKWTSELPNDSNAETSRIFDTNIMIETFQSTRESWVLVKKLSQKSQVFDKETKTWRSEDRTWYVYPENPSYAWTNLFKFDLKEYINADEYKKIVGKNLQEYFLAEKAPELDDATHNEKYLDGMSLGEQLGCRLNIHNYNCLFYGNYGRFEPFELAEYKHYEIPENNILCRWHPGVKKYEAPVYDFDPHAGSDYRPSDKYRRWQFPNSGFMKMYSINGIKDIEDKIKFMPEK